MRDKDRRRNLFGEKVFSAFVREMYLQGISKSEIARRCRTSLQTVGWWFSNRKLPYDRIIKICEAFKSEDFIDVVVQDIDRILFSDIKRARKGRYITLKKELLSMKKNANEKEVVDWYRSGGLKHHEFVNILSCLKDLIDAVHTYSKNHVTKSLGERNA